MSNYRVFPGPILPNGEQVSIYKPNCITGCAGIIPSEPRAYPWCGGGSYNPGPAQTLSLTMDHCDPTIQYIDQVTFGHCKN